MLRLVAALVLTGCADLLGFEDPTAIEATDIPSCASGWTHRTTVEITNSARDALVDYQVSLGFNGEPLFDAGVIGPYGDDIRITDESGALLPYAIEEGPVSSDARIWVRVPRVPYGRSRLYLYSGNALAPPASDFGATFVDVGIANASFETLGAWGLTTLRGPTATVELANTKWATHGSASLFFDYLIVPAANEDHHVAGTTRVSQAITVPDGGLYVARFDAYLLSAVWNPNLFDASSIVMSLGNGAAPLWRQPDHDGAFTGLYRGAESVPFGPGTTTIDLTLAVAYGVDRGYLKGYLDNLRVRRHVDPEPVAAITAVEAICPP